MTRIDTRRARRKTTPLPGCGGLVLCGLLLLACWSGSAWAQDQWAWRDPLPQGNQARGVAYGNDLYVAAGEAGTVLVSDDGIEWSIARAGVPGQVLRGIAYGNGVFIAAGEDGVLLESADGMIWTDVATDGLDDLWGVRFVNGGFIVVGAAGALLTSVDGDTWEIRTTGVTADVLDVAYGAGQYVAAIGPNLQFAQFLTSTDAVTWTPLQAMELADFGSTTSIVYSGDQFVAAGAWGMLSVGLVLTSPDGVVWTQHDTPSGVPLNSLAWGDGRYIALGGADSPDTLSIAVTSTDGITWTRMEYFNEVLAQELAHENGDWFTFTPFGDIHRSVDGIDWAPVVGPAKSASLQAIVEGDGLLVAVALGRGIVSSTDGIEWTVRAAPPGRSGGFFDLAYGDGMFVAVGNDPLDGPPFFRGTIYTSPDGIDWTPIDFAGALDGKPVYGVAWGAGSFVATGSGSFFGDAGPLIITSQDGGATWQGQSPATAEPMARVTYGDGRFVAIAQDSSAKAFVSNDAGITWQESMVLGSAAPLVDIAYADGRFLVAALRTSSGTTRTEFLGSNDAQLWESQATVDYRAWSLGAGAGGFLVGANDGYVLESADGAAWTPGWTGAAEPVNDVIARANGHLVAVTDTGGILERLPPSHTVTPVAGSNGSIEPSTPQSVGDGETIAFTITPDAGYLIDSVRGCDGTLAGDVWTTAPIVADCLVSATFAPIPVETWIVTPVAGAHGGIEPSTPQSVDDGGTIAFTITADAGYLIESVAGCGGTLDGDVYTTAAVVADCTIEARFGAADRIFAGSFDGP